MLSAEDELSSNVEYFYAGQRLAGVECFYAGVNLLELNAFMLDTDLLKRHVHYTVPCI